MSNVFCPHLECQVFFVFFVFFRVSGLITNIPTEAKPAAAITP